MHPLNVKETTYPEATESDGDTEDIDHEQDPVCPVSKSRMRMRGLHDVPEVDNSLSVD